MGKSLAMLAGAEAILRGLTASDPYDPCEWMMLGMTAIREKNHQQALECFRHAQALIATIEREAHSGQPAGAR